MINITVNESKFKLITFINFIFSLFIFIITFLLILRNQNLIIKILLILLIILYLILQFLVIFIVYQNFIKKEVYNLTKDIIIDLKALESFLNFIVIEITGIEKTTSKVVYKKDKNMFTIFIYLIINEKNDYIRFAERIKQRILHDLEFNFSIKNIENIYIEYKDIKLIK